MYGISSFVNLRLRTDDFACSDQSPTRCLSSPWEGEGEKLALRHSLVCKVKLTFMDRTLVDTRCPSNITPWTDFWGWVRETNLAWLEVHTWQTVTQRVRHQHKPFPPQRFLVWLVCQLLLDMLWIVTSVSRESEGRPLPNGTVQKHGALFTVPHFATLTKCENPQKHCQNQGIVLLSALNLTFRKQAPFDWLLREDVYFWPRVCSLGPEASGPAVWPMYRST